MTKAKWSLWAVMGIVALGLAARAATNLPFGKVTTGSINSAAQVAKYSFTANTGDYVDFTVVATSGTLNPLIQVFTSNGSTPFASAENYFLGCQGGPVELNSVKLPASPGNTYIVWISDCGSTNTGSYSMYAQDTTNPALSTTLSIGQTATSSIGAVALSDTYTLTGTKGDVLDFSAIATGSSPTFIPRFRLYNPDGSALSNAENYFLGCQGGELEMNTVTLPASGTYTLLVGDCNDAKTGPYTVYAQSTRSPSPTPSSFLWGEVQTGTVKAVAGLTQSTPYSFTVAANDTIALTAVVSTGSLMPRVRLYNPDGSLNSQYQNYFLGCQSGPLNVKDVKLTTAGTYIALVDDCNHVNPGDYTLSTQCTGVCPMPVPAISSISPTSVLAGSGIFTLTVNGSNFVSENAQSVVDWDGGALPNPNPAAFSITQLTVSVPASDLTTAGKHSVTVFTPTPGGGTSNQAEFDVDNPVPAVTSISPLSPWIAGACPATITVNGSNFNGQTIVQWNGTALATTLVSASQVTADFPASLCVGGTDSLTIWNPTPGGGTSSVVTVNINNPKPILNSLSPNSKTSGVPAFTLTANGSAFVSSSVVQWNGTSLVTTYVSPKQLTAAVPASNIACGASIPITVFTPTPAGGTSSAITLPVNNPMPAVSSISPTTAAAGAAQLTLTVNGSNFRNCSVVQWTAPGASTPTNLTTTYVSSTKLTAVLPASALVNPGSANVTVSSPTPGGGTASPAQPFTIGAYPVPALTSISPTNTLAGSPGFVLTLNGSNFTQQSTVDWNGVQVSGTLNFLSSGQVTIPIPAALIATGASDSVTVCNPTTGGGGGCSNSEAYVVYNPLPAVSSISPTNTAAGGADFTLTVNGSNFVAASVVQWTGQGAASATNLATTFGSAAQVTATVPAALITGVGTATVCVYNPVIATLGGGTSSPCQTFTITNPGPTISPAAGSYGSGLMITITAPGNMPGATIYYTTDGTNPSTSSIKYSSPFFITSASTTVKGIAVLGSATSAVSSSVYVIGGSPTVLDLPATKITSSGGVISALVTGRNLPGQVWFAYGTSPTSLTTTTPAQTLNASNSYASFSAVLTGLTADTTYYYQAWATTDGGMSSGKVLSFTTSK